MELPTRLGISTSVNTFRIRSCGFHEGFNEVAFTRVTHTHKYLRDMWILTFGI